MKLGEYIEKLVTLIKKNPKAVNYTVICSSDDEGNYFREVYYDPGVGIFEESEFTEESQVEHLEGNLEGLNAVCIN